jgi:LPPG:FO 2-phospho-L-lactate transferase
VCARGRETGLQEFMIRERGAGPIEDIRFEGADDAVPTPEVLAAVAGARAIVIGPSNPVISIGPILAIPGMTDALAAAPAPVVAVSPIVGGAVLKGPTAACMEWAGRTVDAAGVAATYAGVIEGLVCDEACDLLPALRTTTRMDDAGARRRLAYETLRFAEALRP